MCFSLHSELCFKWKLCISDCHGGCSTEHSRGGENNSCTSKEVQIHSEELFTRNFPLDLLVWKDRSLLWTPMYALSNIVGTDWTSCNAIDLRHRQGRKL